MYSNSLVAHHYCIDINVNCSQLTYLEFLFSERRSLKVAEAALHWPITALSAPLTWHQAANSAQNDENLVSFASGDRALQLLRVFVRPAKFLHGAFSKCDVIAFRGQA
jgi:hypothetical protein